MPRKKLGEILIEEGLITPEQLEEALRESKKTGEPIGQVLIDLGYITPSDLGRVLQKQFNLTYEDITRLKFDPSVKDIIPEDIIRKNRVIPLREENGYLIVGIVPPFDSEIIDRISLLTGKKVRPVIITESEYRSILEQVYDITERAKEVIKKLAEASGQSELPEISSPHIDISDVMEEASVETVVNTLIVDAVQDRATDIHLEPTRQSYRVRFRVDGVLLDKMELPRWLAEQVITRIKVMADMDIAEKRRPQDGHFAAKVSGKEFDFRVATAGTVHGEMLVIRLLDKKNIFMDVGRLGLLPAQEKVFYQLISVPYGMVLVTGPTGSGKTTTLYAALSVLNTPEKEIITIEDPVEYELKGINQINVNIKAGITFASVLRAILRLDPDIILVGEIRDEETAKLAVQAALTGHLVLTTMHTNDAPSAVIRLLEMGIDKDLIAASVVGIVAQRLVRRLCPNCKARNPDPDSLNVFIPVGCPACNHTGYSGRTGIFEIMPVTPEIQKAILERATLEEIRSIAKSQGMVEMWEAGLEKVKAGITTVEELKRVIKVPIEVK